MKYHIEQAIQKTFNIRHRQHQHQHQHQHQMPTDRSGPGYEIGGFAIASQEAQQLNDVLFESGVRTGLYYFTSHGKWSVINLNKIKIKWATRFQQVKTDDGIWTILEGEWKDGTFLPAIQASGDGVRVEIQSLQGLQSLQSPRSPGRVLVPHQSYHQVTDISNQVPQVRFERSTLECITPKSIANISVNRQGIYVNRKYREKIELTTEPVQENDIYLKHYRIQIYLDDQLIDTYTLNYLS